MTIENKPFKNANLHKGVKYTGNSFSDGKSTLRIYDNRGFEYEISFDNFVAIASNNEISKGELIGDFVYAFSENKLILLPIDSEEYKEAIKTTLNRDEKVDESSLTPGDVYLNDKEECIYIGFYNMNKSIAKYVDILVNKQKPSHVFYNNKKNVYEFIKVEKLGFKKDILLANEFEVYFNNYVGTMREKEIEEIYIEKDFDIKKLQKNRNLGDMLFGDVKVDGASQKYSYIKIISGGIYECYWDTDKKNGLYFYNSRTLMMNHFRYSNKRYAQINYFSKLFEDHNQSINNSKEFYLSERSDAYRLLKCRFYKREKYYFKSKEEGELFLKEEYEPILTEWKKNGIGLLMYRFKGPF